MSFSRVTTDPQKREKGVDIDELAKTWGRDGAEHLIYIDGLRAQQAERRQYGAGLPHPLPARPRPSQPPRRVPKADLEAVRALDAFSVGTEESQAQVDGGDDGEGHVAGGAAAAAEEAPEEITEAEGQGHLDESVSLVEPVEAAAIDLSGIATVSDV